MGILLNFLKKNMIGVTNNSVFIVYKTAIPYRCCIKRFITSVRA